MALPPQVLTGKYLAVYDTYGEPKVIQIPYGTSILTWDGSDLRFSTGSEDDEIRLPHIHQQEGGSLAGVLGVTGAGGLRMLMRPSNVADDLVLTNIGGALLWKTKGQFAGTVGGFPSGNGVAIRGTTDGAEAQMLSDHGLIYINESGQPLTISNGSADGQIMMMVNGVPTFRDPISGSVAGAGGASTAGLTSVVATNTDAATINVRVPKLALSAFDGGADITVNNVNVSAALTASLGAGGLDVGAEGANKWYYAYVISDGTAVSLVISESGPTPSHTNISSYTHYGFVSLFRNDGVSAIVPYRQLGRKFFTRLRNVSDLVSVTTSFAAINQTISLTSFIPPSVKTVQGVMGGTATSGTPANISMAIAGDANGLGYYQSHFGGAVGVFEGFQINAYNFQNIPIVDPTAPALYWKGGGNDNKRRLSISGYEI